MARRWVVLSVVVLSSAASLLAQTATSDADYKYSISTTQAWTDTGLDLQAGDVLQISASADESSVPDRHVIATAGPCDPNGAAAATPATELPLPSAPVGALIVRLNDTRGTPVLVGASKELHIEEPSHLFLGVNIANAPACQGKFRVAIHKSRAASSESGSTPAPTSVPPQAQSLTPESSSAKTQSATPAPAPASDKTEAQPKSRSEQLKSQLSTAAQVFMSGQFGTGKPEAGAAGSSNAASGSATAGGSAVTAPLKVSDSPLDSDLRKNIESLPRRVNDQFKNLGDMVNFVMVGSQKDVQAALEAANWHVADTDNRKAALTAVLETYENKDYLQMPMSTLYLFGRKQDFGYEQAEPIAMVASRHHFRIWKTSFTYKDKEVWVGAGTHDIGFAKDRRNGSVTHKIDPAVDGERDNIGSSLEKAGKVKSMSYYLPGNPVQEAKNATGDGYHSDGRLLVIFLQ